VKQIPRPAATLAAEEVTGLSEIEAAGLHHRCERRAARPACAHVIVLGAKVEICPSGDFADRSTSTEPLASASAVRETTPATPNDGYRAAG
jgi:hypothetical protein